MRNENTTRHEIFSIKFIFIISHHLMHISVLFCEILRARSKTKRFERFLSFVLVLRQFQYSINMVDEARDNHAQQIERAEIGNLVRSRMESLNLPSNDYDEVSEKRNHLSYVIINPSCDLKLEEGDIM